MLLLELIIVYVAYRVIRVFLGALCRMDTGIDLSCLLE